MTEVVVGRDLSLTIGGDVFDAQASTVTLTREMNQFSGETLAGRFQKTIDATGTLSVEMFADWGATESICAALFDAALAAPDTALSFSFDVNGDIFSGTCYPNSPSIGGGAVDVLTTTVELAVVNGTITRA